MQNQKLKLEMRKIIGINPSAEEIIRNGKFLEVESL